MSDNKSTTKTLWVFGDSFTDHYYGHLPPEIKDDIIQWPSILSQQYNFRLNHFGGYRNSIYTNPQIIHSVLCNLYKIKKEDCVVIGLSDPIRIINIKDKAIRGFNISNYYRNKTKKDKNNQDSKIDLYSSMYVENVLLQNDEIIYKFYKEQVNGLEKMIRMLGCSTCVFGHHIWKSFESVTRQTNGEFIDHHWSKRGHEQMAKYIESHIFKKNKSIM